MLLLLMAVVELCAAAYAFLLLRWPDNFFADDSYFYFQVAWNFAHGHGSTFNGLMPTNGYHPLWMLVCSLVYLLVKSKDVAVHAIAGVIATLDLLTVGAVLVLLRRAGVAFPLVASVVLLPFLFSSQLGTEGALGAACLSATLLATYQFARRPTRALAFAYALGAALTVLSRLDNIFIVTALTVALIALVPAPQRKASLRFLLTAAPIAMVLWGTYLWSNHHYFGTLQPISGMLKSHARGEHRLGTNLPHTALLDLAIILVGLLVLARQKRDLFFRVVELPMAAGVLVHALYIVFVMSSETRWSWYYTTWTLLAAIVLARSVSALLGNRTRLLQVPVLAACATVLLILVVHTAHDRGHDDPAAREPGFQANVVDGAHLTTLLAFDKPGRIAYYSTARIIPLDGLMGDLHFQQELGDQGVAELDHRYHVDGFIGPPQPLDQGGKRDFCDAIFLSATRFQCTPRADGNFDVTGAEVFARLSGRSAGVVPLPASNRVWNAQGYVAVWRVALPEMGTRP